MVAIVDGGEDTWTWRAESKALAASLDQHFQMSGGEDARLSYCCPGEADVDRISSLVQSKGEGGVKNMAARVCDTHDVRVGVCVCAFGGVWLGLLKMNRNLRSTKMGKNC